MAVRYGDDEIARVLSKLGRTTARGVRWSEQSVRTPRRNYNIAGQRRSKPDPEILTLAQAASACAVSTTTIQRMVTAGLLKVVQVAPFAPWRIRRTDLEASPVREVIERLRSTGKLVVPEPTGDNSARQPKLFS